MLIAREKNIKKTSKKHQKNIKITLKTEPFMNESFSKLNKNIYPFLEIH